jgi:hypothetical protein
VAAAGSLVLDESVRTLGLTELTPGLAQPPSEIARARNHPPRTNTNVDR